MTGLGASIYVGFFALAALWLFLTSDGPLTGESEDQGQRPERSNSTSTSAGSDGSSPWLVQPLVAEIGVGVAVAAVGEQRDHRPAAPLGDHLGQQAERAPQIRPGRRTDPAAQHRADVPCGGDRSRVGHRQPSDPPRRAETTVRPAAGRCPRSATTSPSRRRRAPAHTTGRTPSSPDRRRTTGSRSGGTGCSGRWSRWCRRCPRPPRSTPGIGWASCAHLLEDRLGDVVVAAPVGGPFGVGELVEVMAAGLLRQPLGLGVHLRRLRDEMATAALGFDQGDLAGAGRRRASPR